MTQAALPGLKKYIPPGTPQTDRYRCSLCQEVVDEDERLEHLSQHITVVGAKGAEHVYFTPVAQLVLDISYDQFSDGPIDEWKHVSFNQGHGSFESPWKYLCHPTFRGDIKAAEIGFQRKLDCGTAFILSCYSHGSDHWALQGECHQCQWDTAQVAGLLIWKDDVRDLPKGYEEREKWARGWLEEFTNWVNGRVYSFSLEDMNSGEILDCCGGFFDTDHMFREIRGCFADFDCEITLEGDAASLADGDDLGGKLREDD